MILSRIVVTSKETEVQQISRRFGQEIFVADDMAETLDIAKTVNPDLIIFDDQISPAQIRQFVDVANTNSINVPVIIIGNGKNENQLSVEFIKNGASDYINGTQNCNSLEQAINKIKNNSGNSNNEQDQDVFFADDIAASISMVGKSKATLKTLKMIKLVAASQCNPVLVTGETGTGKEVAAKAIHTFRHPDKPFIAINCAALTANLLESELFGHAKGSFTGADREKTGFLELAESGTLFLDEISEMPLDLQAKLLRVLQEKTFRKVGGTKLIKCRATIIASSNRNLKKEVQQKHFRRDLYYRLNICPITLAPLRSQHKNEDIPLLAKYFLENSSICPQKKGKIKSITKLALEVLQNHDWPGNVRELYNIIERAILLETTDKIGMSSIIIDMDQYDEQAESNPLGHLKDFSLSNAERELISRALQKTCWQKTQAAALLGITRATLYAKVKQYNIEKGSYIPKLMENKAQDLSLCEPVTVP